MIDLATFKKKLSNMTAADFNHEYLFDSDVWYFSDNSPKETFGDYDDFKSNVSRVFTVNPNEVAIVGSAKYGFSPSPLKKFRAFNAESDIDVVVVAPLLFDEVWASLRAAYYAGYPVRNEPTEKGTSTRARDIFKKFITVKREDEVLTTHLRSLEVLLDLIQAKVAAPLGISEDLRFRIYASWSDVSNYHNWGIAQLQGDAHAAE